MFKTCKIANNSSYIGAITLLGITALCLFAPEIYALAEGDKLAELTEVVTTGQKMTRTVCYIIGMASGAVGSYRFVQTQSFATAGIAAAISVASFKFPTLVTSAAII